MFWIRGEKQGLGGECESGKMNWKLATNARMFWIRGEKQGLGGECESGKMNWKLATNA